MADFEPIPLSANDKLTTEIFNRFQRRVVDAFAAIPVIGSPNVTKISAGDYRVLPTDMFILADASGGAVKIILPEPTSRQFFTVKKSVDSRNKVTIVGQNGSPSIEVFYGADRSVTVLCDASSWGQL